MADPFYDSPQGTYVHPLTGATSATPQEGYVFVPRGAQLQQQENGGYVLAGQSGAVDTETMFDSPFKQYQAPNKQVNLLGPDPFDVKIREAALNDLMLKRRGTTRTSTFTTGPRGVQGPNKTVLG